MPGGLFHLFDTTSQQLGIEIAGGVGKLGEDKKLLLRVALIDQLDQGSQLGVRIGLPVAAKLQKLEQGLRIRQQVFGQRLDEQGTRQPFETAFQCTAVCLIRLGGTGAVVDLSAQAVGGGWVGNIFVAVVICQQTIGVLVVMAGVEQFGTLRAQRNIQTVLDGVQDDALACVSMALEMKKHMRIMQQRWGTQGIDAALEIRMGINTGYCTVGNFGTDQRLDYTALGTEVNLASRLETAAPAGEILISDETHTLVKDSILCEDKGVVNVKGFSEPVRIYSVIDFHKNLGDKQSYFEQRADGFSMYLDLDKVKNYDRDRVLKTLLTAATRLRNKAL